MCQFYHEKNIIAELKKSFIILVCEGLKMAEKKVLTIISCGVMALACFLYFTLEKTKISQTSTPQKQSQIISKQPQTNKPIEPKHDLYTSTPYDLPFSSIVDISQLPTNVKKYIDEVLESAQGFYYLNLNADCTKIKILLQNPIKNENVYNRHRLEFLELHINEDGSFDKKIFSPMYAGEENEIANAVDEIYDKYDIWSFDKSSEPYLPLKHKKYNEKGKVLFTEKWDNSPNALVKYQMKNSKNKTISILKEIVENDSNYRQEHILYDEDGNIEISISINFEGANITRFSYYNAGIPSESINIFSEYADGLKTKETAYDLNYKLLKTYSCKYIDGERKSISVTNENGEEIKTING